MYLLIDLYVSFLHNSVLLMTENWFASLETFLLHMLHVKFKQSFALIAIHVECIILSAIRVLHSFAANFVAVNGVIIETTFILNFNGVR